MKRVYKCQACGKVFRVAGGELIGDIPGQVFEDQEVGFCPYCASDRIELVNSDS
jgi:rubredoxin